MPDPGADPVSPALLAFTMTSIPQVEIVGPLLCAYL
jgi:hypothetical protein